MAGLKKIILKNSTQMSLHERFTYLRHQPARQEGTTVQTVRANLALQQQASARNRRLAAQMERRPAVMAALKIKQKTLRQRLGDGLRQRIGETLRQRIGVNRLSVTDRLSARPLGQMRSQSVPRSPRARLSVGIRGRLYRPQTQFQPVRQMRAPSVGRQPRGTLSRSASLSNLSRSQSTGNLNSAGRFQNQIQNRTYQNTNRFSVNRGNQYRPQRGMRATGIRGYNVQRTFRGARGQLQGQRRGQYVNNYQQQGQRGQRGGRGNYRQGNQSVRGVGVQGMRGQGRGRGRGQGRGRGRGRGAAPPSREELDKQLDLYMAGTKSTLDKELDSYMNQGQ